MCGLDFGLFFFSKKRGITRGKLSIVLLCVVLHDIAHFLFFFFSRFYIFASSVFLFVCYIWLYVCMLFKYINKYIAGTGKSFWLKSSGRKLANIFFWGQFYYGPRYLVHILHLKLKIKINLWNNWSVSKVIISFKHVSGPVLI